MLSQLLAYGNTLTQFSSFCKCSVLFCFHRDVGVAYVFFQSSPSWLRSSELILASQQRKQLK